MQNIGVIENIAFTWSLNGSLWPLLAYNFSIHYLCKNWEIFYYDWQKSWKIMCVWYMYVFYSGEIYYYWRTIIRIGPHKLHSYLWPMWPCHKHDQLQKYYHGLIYWFIAWGVSSAVLICSFSNKNTMQLRKQLEGVPGVCTYMWVCLCIRSGRSPGYCCREMVINHGNWVSPSVRWPSPHWMGTN